jgi:hypothetical protein
MKKLLKYGSILLLIWMIWDANLIAPIRIFSSYVHQAGHLGIALLFSYKPGTDILINLSESSYQILDQKTFLSAFFIANGGYLANFLFVMFFLYLKTSALKKYTPGLFAIAFVSVTYVYAGVSPHLLYAALFAGFALVLHMINRDRFFDYTLNILAMSNLAYVLYEVFYNNIYYWIIQKTGFRSWTKEIPVYSDAIQLETLTRVPAILWGLLWAIVIIFCCILFLIRKAESETSVEFAED